jgi:hypothetical protein
MKSRFGKITVAAVVLLMAVVLFWAGYLAPRARADTKSPAQVFKFLGNYTNPYVLLRDYDSGQVIDKTTGVAAAGETYVANPIMATRDTITGFWTANIPAMSVNYAPVLTIGDAATPTYTDTTTSWFYDPVNNRTIDAGLPAANYQQKKPKVTY